MEYNWTHVDVEYNWTHVDVEYNWTHVDMEYNWTGVVVLHCKRSGGDIVIVMLYYC